MGNEPRQSNFELLRIVAMFAIVVHHYVVNSTVMAQFTPEGGGNMMNYAFLRLIGVWGKTAINPFVMMSGFFMCTSNLTLKRYCKIFFEWIFYSWVIYAIFLLTGYESIVPCRLLQLVFPFFTHVDVWFIESFVWFYLGVPIYNLIIRRLDKKGLYLLTAALLAMFVIPITFFGNTNVFHHVFWYMTLYFVGACIRLYPYEWMMRKKVVGSILLVAILAASGALILRICSDGFIAKALGRICSVHESSTLFAFVVGTGVFLLFKNIKLSYKPWINKIASCMFGVLCIHAASNAMRKWLWQDVCQVPSMANASLGMLALHAFGCVITIMIICLIIDFARKKWIETPIFKKYFNG